MNEERIHILVVDDEESLRVPLQKFLRSEPFYYEVDIAADGSQAMDLVHAAHGHYDVAIIDQNLMPGPNGIQVMCEIRERYPDVECIIFTGWGEEDSRKAIEAGAFRYLEKARFNYDELGMLILTAAQQVRLRLISRSILLQHDLPRVLEEIASAARSLALADQAAIILLELQSNELDRYPDNLPWHGHYKNKELSRETMRTGKVVLVQDLEREKDVDPALLASKVRSFVGVPIPHQEEYIGVLYVYSQKPNHFSAWGTIALLQTLAGQASLAITNARSFQQIRSHAGYMEALVRAGRGFSAAESEEALLTHAWGFLKEHLQVSSFFLALHDAERNLLRFSIALDNEQPVQINDRPLHCEGVDLGISGYVFNSGRELVWLTRQEEEEEYARIGIRSIHAGDPPYPESCFLSPLRVSDRTLGVISIQSARPKAFSMVQLDAFRAFSSQMAVALEKARLFETLQRTSEHLSSLNQVVLEISKEHTQEALLQKVIDMAIDLIKAQGGGIYLLDPSSQWLELRASRGLPETPKYMRIQKDEGVSGVILSTGEAFSVSDYATWELRIPEYEGKSITAVAGVPIRFGDRILGTLVVHHTRADRVFDSTSIALLQHFANHTGLAIEKINLMDTLRALQDVSTNMVSTTEYKEVLNQTCRLAFELFGVEHNGLVLFDANLETGHVEGEYPPVYNTIHQKVPLSTSHVERMLATEQQTIVYDNIHEHEEELGDILPILEKYDIRSIVLVPIVYQGRVLGSFSLDSIGHTRTFLPEEVALCKVFAANVAIVVENARLIHETRQGKEYVEALFQGTNAISQGTKTSEVLKSIVRAACHATGAWRAVVMLADEGGSPKVVVHEGFADKDFPSPTIRAAGVSRQVLNTKEPVFFSDLLEHKDLAHPRMIEQGSRAAACLPLDLGDQERSIGVLWVQFTESRPFSEIERNSLKIYANQAALALKKARLLEQVRIARDAAKVVSDVSVLQNLPGTLVSIVRGTRDTLIADAVVLITYDAERSEFGFPPVMIGVWDEAAIYRMGAITPHSVAWKIIELDGIHKAESAAEDPFMNGGFVAREQIQSSAGVSLQVGDRKVGVLFINYRSPHHFTEDDEINIRMLANQAAVAIRNAQLYEAEQLFQQALLAIQETSAALSGELNQENLLRMITDKAANLFEAAAASLMLWDDQEHPQKLVIRSAVGLSEEYQEQQQISKAVVDQVWEKNNEGPYVFNLHHSPLGSADLVNRESLSNVLVSSLMVDGDLIGILNIYARNQPRKFDEHEKELARIFANHAAIAIKNARAYEKLERTKGLVGSRTALAWMSMASNIWQHNVTGDAETIREEVMLCFIQGEVPAEGRLHDHLEKIGWLAAQIVEQKRKMNLPNSQEEEVRSISLNELIQERAQQLMEPLEDEESKPELMMKLNLDERMTVRVSPEWLRRAFDIVIKNALQATELQQQRQITILTRENRGNAEIVIQDNGPGIPQERQQKLFVDKIDKAPGEKGLGMGLLMAHVILQTYGGKIYVEGTGANGTSMVISLPIERTQVISGRER